MIESAQAQTQKILKVHMPKIFSAKSELNKSEMGKIKATFFDKFHLYISLKCDVRLREGALVYVQMIFEKLLKI